MSEQDYVTTSYEFPTRVSHFYGISPKVKVNDDTGEKKLVYSSSLLIPKKDKQTNAQITSIIDRLSAEKWPNGTPKAAKITYRDGDIEGRHGVPDSYDAGEAPYGGNHFINTKEQAGPPMIIGPAGNVLKFEDIPRDLIVSGDYVCARLKCFTWGPSGFGTGVSWELVSIQLVKKGEPLASGKDSGTKGFKPIEDLQRGEADPLGVM